jgi:sporulation protein YlmC with PRC-barrel domain
MGHKEWSYENLAAGKLDIVWVRAKRVPSTLKKYQVIREVGSTLGHVIEVDMDTFRKNGNIIILVGVVDHKNIPAMAKITTKKLMIYYIYIQVEQVVEAGWPRPEEEYIKDFDEMEDTLSQEMGDK